MVREVLSKSAAVKDKHLAKNWPGSSAGPNKTRAGADDQLDYEELAAEDAKRELEEARREDAEEASRQQGSSVEASTTSIDTSTTASSSSS
ncbi:hypothetical protein OC846_005697 [Tilletia horrida]|uniref:Uncharacterized protein n=1 Tax=Tilletia horrida TaxID=155126 RepID=A0AAN6GKB8_9BASI|nr:hypothetical protein OC846_005697 [Tilletia horrida]KAK0547217.1 hypothetical protein OC845_004204 [Tilletia horrida]KAK0562650.1 hypothetical protein OC861_005212 [Tilletia horrida]